MRCVEERWKGNKVGMGPVLREGVRGRMRGNALVPYCREAGLSRRIGGRVCGGLLVLVELGIDGGD